MAHSAVKQFIFIIYTKSKYKSNFQPLLIDETKPIF